jgi:putative SOS response-associated peptidase YedK
MCGKFTAMASWAQVVAFSQPLTNDRYQKAGQEDRELTYRVMANLPVITWDREKGERRVVPMRWGFPHPKDWRRPQPIHARAETIDETRAFADAFHDGQRGIVLFKTFNEAKVLENGKSEQYTITLNNEQASGFAFLWRRFEIKNVPMPMLACVMVTVPANALIRTLDTPQELADRMPVILAKEDWAKWLGEEAASVDNLKACLKTVEGIGWTMAKEVRKAQANREKPTASNPTGLR